MKHLTTNIDVALPFSLRATVLSHGWHECAPMSWCAGGRCFQLIGRCRGEAVRISVIESSRTARRVRLRVDVEGNKIDDAFLEHVRGDLRWILRLDEDLTEFYALCVIHPTLHVLPRIGAGRMIRSACMAENIIKAICGTNVNWTQAVKMINRIGQLGPPVRHFVHLNAWPTPREILRGGERYLNEVCRLGYRTDSILKFCRDITDGGYDPEALRLHATNGTLSSDDALKELLSIKGVGPSSANYLLAMLGFHDRMSIDSATIAHVSRTHTKGRKPTVRQVERIYAPYGKWRQLVWWLEYWLTWDSALAIIHDTPGLDEPIRTGKVTRHRAAS